MRMGMLPLDLKIYHLSMSLMSSVNGTLRVGARTRNLEVKN